MMLHPGRVVENQGASSCCACRSVVVRRARCRRMSCPYVCRVSQEEKKGGHKEREKGRQKGRAKGMAQRGGKKGEEKKERKKRGKRRVEKRGGKKGEGEKGGTFRSHFGSRGTSFQVNSVAVLAHVFHSSFLESYTFWLFTVLCLLTSCLTLALSMRLTGPYPNRLFSLLLRVLVLQTAVVPTFMAWAPVTVSQWMRSSMISFHSLHNSKNRSRRFPLARIGCPVWNHMSRLHLEDLPRDLQRWNRISVPSLHDFARSKRMQPQPQMFPARQDLGLCSNRLMGLQPQGPMARCHLTTTRPKLDIFSTPDDENVRSAVLLHFLCEQFHAGVST